MYEGYEPEAERLREALCTLGNGYFATRGAASETITSRSHYPGTYVAGCYDRLTSSVRGRQVENADLVNLPNWLPLRYRIRPAGDRPRTVAVTGPRSPRGTPADARSAPRHADPAVRLPGRGRPSPVCRAVPSGAHGQPASRRPAHGFHRGRVGGGGRGGGGDRRRHPERRCRAVPGPVGLSSDRLVDRNGTGRRGVARMSHRGVGHRLRAGLPHRGHVRRSWAAAAR